jgi:hypothetical protein
MAARDWRLKFVGSEVRRSSISFPVRSTVRAEGASCLLFGYHRHRHAMEKNETAVIVSFSLVDDFSSEWAEGVEQERSYFWKKKERLASVELTEKKNKIVVLK